MEYVRCERCDLNYKPINESYCVVCKKELSGGSRSEDEELIEELICPFCEKRQIQYGEEMCAVCKAKKEKPFDAFS